MDFFQFLKFSDGHETGLCLITCSFHNNEFFIFAVVFLFSPVTSAFVLFSVSSWEAFGQLFKSSHVSINQPKFRSISFKLFSTSWNQELFLYFVDRPNAPRRGSAFITPLLLPFFIIFS